MPGLTWCRSWIQVFDCHLWELILCQPTVAREGVMAAVGRNINFDFFHMKPCSIFHVIMAEFYSLDLRGWSTENIPSTCGIPFYFFLSYTYLKIFSFCEVESYPKATPYNRQIMSLFFDVFLSSCWPGRGGHKAKPNTRACTQAK